MSDTAPLKYGAQGPALLNVQPYFLTVGKPGGFETPDDFHKFAVDCGFTGVTMPLGNPFIDPEKAFSSRSYREDFVAHHEKLKLPIRRFEAHVTTQNRSIAASRVPRFAHFVGMPLNSSVAAAQARASAEFRNLVDICALFGFKELVGFPGGRGFPAAMAKWSAWPKDFGVWVIALLAATWKEDLEYAADRGVVVTFELGHPEEDLLTGANFKLFRKFVGKKARRAVGLNADKSHFDMVGVDALPHFLASVEPVGEKEEPVVVTNHYKAGVVREVEQGTDSAYGGWVNFGQASHTFATIGIACDLERLAAYHQFNASFAQIPVWEGECVIIGNPKQAMKIGAHNMRAIIGGRLDQLIRLPDVPAPAPRAKTNVPALVGPEGDPVPLEEWAGGAFDEFAEGPSPAWVLLEMSRAELAAVVAMLETETPNLSSLYAARLALAGMVA